MSKKTKTLIVSLVLVFLFFVFLGSFKKKQNLENVKKVNEEVLTSTSTYVTSSTLITETNKVKPFLTDRYIYIKLVYPNLYVYNLDKNSIQIIDVETKKVNNIYKAENLTKFDLSYDQSKLLFYSEKAKSWYLLDLIKDELFKFPKSVQKAVWTPEGIVLISKDKKLSLLLFDPESKKTKKIREINFKNPEIVYLSQDKVLIYESQTPSQVFVLRLFKPKNLEVFIKEKDKYSILSYNELIFISDSNQSQIIDVNKEVIKTFNWTVKPENCSFQDLLICGLGSKIFVYDYKEEKEGELDLGGNFDICFPFLTSDSLVFFNCFDSQFYSIKLE